MKAKHVAPLLIVAGFALAGCTAQSGFHLLAEDAPRALPGDGPVSVSWTDPAQFAELKSSSSRFDSRRGAWLTALAQHLRDRATAVLPRGERLELTITDVQRAGRLEPWHRLDMQDVRVMRDIYPPRMTLQFRHFDASGALVSEGERKLVDPGYLTHITPINHTDPLRYEKRMLDMWLRREFRTAAK